MALAIAYDDQTNLANVRGNRGGTTGRVTQIPFFGSRDNPTLPHANLNQRDPGLINRTHFHVNDQFQVVVDGKGMLGRHNLTPYCVHFARAYTPYGPLAADTSTSLTALVLRARYDPGSQHLPKELDKLKQVPDRRPWQIMRPVVFPAVEAGMVATDIMLQAVPGIEDEQGLAAYTLTMKPGAQAQAPDPSGGDGQYLVVLKGSLWHENKERKALALVFVYPKERPFQIYAGSAGLEALILNFPRPQSKATDTTTSMHATPGFKTWQCALCALVYDEAAGMPGDGIAPGTRWEDVPDTWTCPDCSAAKSDFEMVEV